MLPARHALCFIPAISQTHISTLSDYRTDARNTQFGRFLDEEIKLLALKESDGQCQIKRRLRPQGLNLCDNVQLCEVAAAVFNRAVKLFSLAVEDVDFIAAFQTQHVAQMPRFLRRKLHALLIRKRGRRRIESSACH